MVPLTAALALTATFGQISITVAPDQSVPYSFVDEPLVVEVFSQADAVVSFDFAITDPAGDVHFRTAPFLRLRRGEAYWLSFPDAPRLTGMYRLSWRLTNEGPGESSPPISFARGPRPTSDARLPLEADLADADAATLNVLASLGVQSARLSFHRADPLGDARWVSRMGLSPELVVDLGVDGLDVAAVENIAKYGEDVIALWELQSGGPEAYIPIARAIRRGDPLSRLAVRAETPEELGEVLAAGLGRYIDIVALAGDQGLGAYRDVAERSGYEGLVYRASLCVSEEAPCSFASRLLDALAAGYGRFIVASDRLVDASGLRPAYAAIRALALMFAGAVYVGPLVAEEGGRVEVFRGRDGQGWTAAVWSEAGAGIAHLPLDGATGLRFADSLGNALSLDDLTDNAARGASVASPLVVTGSGGGIVALAAREYLRREAKAFADNSPLLNALDSPAQDAIRGLADASADISVRSAFFLLIRLLPELERRWAEGELARSAAVPIMARVARMARAIAVLEQEQGEPFLEPFSDALAKCGEYQSLYLTGLGAVEGSLDRGDWLLEEVNRLAAEARGLAAEGRRIEADAVAALAEWRARGLQYARKPFPLSQPEPPSDPARK